MERNWVWGGKGSSRAKSRAQAGRAGHGVSKRTGSRWVERGVFGCGPVTLPSYHAVLRDDGEPKPRSSRFPQGRPEPVFTMEASHAGCFCCLL